LALFFIGVFAIPWSRRKGKAFKQKLIH
jgi:hypothetical protein